MLDKRASTISSALDGLSDGATVIYAGFGTAGQPEALLRGLLNSGRKDLTLVSLNATLGNDSVAELVRKNCVRKIVTSYARSILKSTVVDDAFHAGQLEIELVPQGTLTERVRAAAAGLGGFYTRTGAGTVLARGKETRTIDGEEYVLEGPLRGDFAFIRASRGDRWGNLTYRGAGRVNNPSIAGSARITVAQVEEIVDLGCIGPNEVVTPSILVDRVVEAN